MPAPDLIAAEIAGLRADFASLAALVAPLAVRQRTRPQQAKRAGVHRSTLWRREVAARAQLALDRPGGRPRRS